MTRIRISTLIDAPPRQVWAYVRDIPSHVEWMADADAIRMTSRRRHGVGTTFECDTRIGPFRVTDRMEVTEWDEGHAIGVRHVGLVTGSGRFRLERRRRGRSEFTWEERLTFPPWLGGPLGGLVGAPIMRAVWRRNLRSLRARVEGTA